MCGRAVSKRFIQENLEIEGTCIKFGERGENGNNIYTTMKRGIE